MAENNKLLLYVAVILFSLLGFVLGMIIVPEIVTMLGDVGIDLTPLLQALIWIVIALITYYGIGWAANTGERTGMLSLTFVLFWIMAAIGLIIGVIALQLVEAGGAAIDLDAMVVAFFVGLPFALIPSLAASLALSNMDR
ncbi:MAG: hypothetical protein ACFFD4_23610 [Candidatus Odinarchaeota archaeon]